MTGMAGHWVAVGLLLVAGLGFAASLIIRPPANAPAAAWRIALGLAVMFTLAPATRWGYFVYPIGLLGWLVLTRPPAVDAVAGPGDPGPGPGAGAGAGLDGQGGIASLGLPVQGGKRSLPASAR
jgi:hypothetical protein